MCNCSRSLRDPWIAGANRTAGETGVMSRPPFCWRETGVSVGRRRLAGRRIEDRRVRRAVDDDLCDGTLIEGAAQRVVDQRVGARHVELVLDDGRATGWDERGLNIALRFGRPLGVDLLEDLTD